jgi:hypothetical protein
MDHGGLMMLLRSAGECAARASELIVPGDPAMGAVLAVLGDFQASGETCHAFVTDLELQCGHLMFFFFSFYLTVKKKPALSSQM